MAVKDYAESKGITSSQVYAQAVEHFLELEVAKGYQRRFDEIYSSVTINSKLRKAVHETGRIARVKPEIASGKELTGSNLKFAIEKGLVELHESANSDVSNDSADPMLTAAATATFKRNE